MTKGVFVLTGTGTSQGVPIIGCTCEVCSSGDYRDKRLRTSAYLSIGGTSVWIDPGPDFRQQVLRLGLKELDAVLVTHEHKDHTGGLDDIRGFNHLLNRDMPIYAWERVLGRLKADYAYAFEEVKYPGIPRLNLYPVDGDRVVIGNIPFQVFTVMHYRLPVLAFRVGSIGYVTDANAISPEGMDILQGVDVLVLDALQPEPHISHFTLDQAIEVAQTIGARRTILTHISHRMGLYTVRNPALPKGIELGYDGLKVEFWL